MRSVATLNVGSGSQKLALFRLDPVQLRSAEPVAEPVWEGKLDATAPGQPPDRLRLSILNHESQSGELLVPRQASLREKVERLLGALWDGPLPGLARSATLEVVGHRVVHGGDRFDRAVVIDKGVEAEIERLGRFSPLHNPPQLEAIRTARSACPQALHVAVFDTAFHRTLEPAAYVYPGPRAWLERGIRRFGFHGTNFRYVYERAAHFLGRDSDPGLRMVICHLGGGCSLAAVRGGRSVDTTMGFTPLDGICMCTRSGSVDPGILLFLLQHGDSADRIERILNKESGLAGLSGLPGDTRVLLPEAARGHEGAALALQVFIHRLRQGIGAMIASLGGLDVLVFTDAIGESEPKLREEACDPFRYLGLKIDPERNNAPARPDGVISAEDSTAVAMVIKGREDWQIAKEALSLLVSP
ncbi:MAG: acetate/propionate family kinase, partial [Verrucomicrobia bacterium]|nr:acetate/propionate family kinase [Verrucomicrobiota bacterium]